MTDIKKTSKTSKILCVVGSTFLLLMGAFHGSGFFYISAEIEKSNAEDFLKEIVPVLFAHPSIHLIGLAAFGVLALFFKSDMQKLTWSIAILILIDMVLAFYLGGLIPGVLLSISACCFVVAGLKESP